MEFPTGPAFPYGSIAESDAWNGSEYQPESDAWNGSEYQPESDADLARYTRSYASYGSAYVGGSYTGSSADPTAKLAPWLPRETAAASGTPLRLAHVTPCFGSGGTEVWLTALAKFLDPRRARLQTCVVTVPEYLDRSYARNLSAPIEVGKADAVRKAARECDVMTFWGQPEMPEWLADCRPPLCIHIAHGEGPWTRAIVERCAPVADHHVAVSAAVHAKVCADVPTTTILNGVDSARLARTRPRDEVRAGLGFGPDDFVVGYLGRFAPEKRTGRIIDALAGLPARFKGLFVGYGDLRRSLLEKADDRIPGRYAFRYAVDYLGDYYAAMDAFCLPSSEEGFALVVLEAMLCGVPVVAGAVGCVPELIQDRVNGLIVPGSPESIAEALTRLDAHPQWRRSLAAEALALADRMGHARRMARDYEDLFDRLWTQKYGPRRAA